MKNKIINKTVSILTVLFPIMCLSFGNGYNVIAPLLLILSLLVISSTPKQLFTRNVNLLICAFIFYFLVFVLSMIVHDERFRIVDGASRFIFCIPIFLLILRYPLKFSWLTNAVVIASYISGFTAMLSVFYFDQGRAFDGDSNWFLDGYMPIQSGAMAMTFGMISLFIATHYLKKRDNGFALVCSIGAAFGVSASILSGSRGNWIFIPIAIGYLIYANRKHFSFNQFTLSAFFILLLPTVIVTTSVENMANGGGFNRIYAVSENLADYEKGHEYSSVGTRLELWKDAFYTFRMYPLLGAGTKERLVLRQRWGDKQLINKTVSLKTYHAHNQFFEALAVRGVIGFIGLMGIFIIPLVIFRRLNQSKSDTLETLNQCGIVSIVMMVGYCLTQAIFKHNSGTIFYPLMTVILLASSMTIYNKKNSRIRS